MKLAPNTELLARRLPVGAEPGAAGTHFRVWAPERTVQLEVLSRRSGEAASTSAPDAPARLHPLEPEGNGYWSGTVGGAGPGTLYRYRLDDGRSYPDPASRYQPQGPHGPSCVVDPAGFAWSDRDWAGVPDEPGPVLYEMHVGTFTPEGTWTAATERLPLLRDLGVTVIQMMPLADFPGSFGWGYDGVLPFAPYHGYGTPDDLHSFVDTAHALGLAVTLDVVYNHFGPDGNYLRAYSPAYFSERHTTDWGDSPNFDGPGSEQVRAYFLSNVRYWIAEYHLDGFRFDATQAIHDTGPDHILAAMVREARAAAGGRRILLSAENEPQDSTLVRAQYRGGYGLDMMGNEDFHHTAVVALTGRRQAYYRNHRGTPQELISALKYGFLYQGQWYAWQGQRRGGSTRGLNRRALIHHLENHDQVANSLTGARLHTLAAPGRWRAMVALQLLGPETPFLFQGQEFASSAPFHYFAHQPPELAELTRRGRTAALAEFESLRSREAVVALPDPNDPETFRSCKLDWSEWDARADMVRLHRDLLILRRQDAVFAGRLPAELDGAVLDRDAFLIRWRAPEEHAVEDRLLLVNLGRDVRLDPAPEPLLAPPPARSWRLRWSSEHPRYGGSGTPAVETESWNLPGASALLMAPGRLGDPDPVVSALYGESADDPAAPAVPATPITPVVPDEP